ncbi:TIGR03899 family protein [Alteromonas confluentis]|uniref:TIGR03899 family protein n=1 Tax=Alteromonas confluentis TaxID=1656094 RepID=A0A1E7Z5S7_9ALTE|nr:TIGR03899 family protein [Alteromonas confluentis]OFC68761.1 TIGR03899 family protein [Alteromonas confluentis]
MKVTDSGNSSAAVPLSTATLKQAPQSSASENVKRSSSASRSATDNVQRIQSLFARVGISPSMIMPDEDTRQRAIKRRNDIQALAKIRNLQAVMEAAMGVSLTETSEEMVDPDWFYAFSQLAENIYSPAMQTLWGKIFAVEVSKPGSFSLRSLETLKALTQRDAAIFSRAASLSCVRQGDSEPRILTGYHQKPGFWAFLGQRQPESLNLASYGVSYPDLLALTDMKLIFASEIESGELEQGQSIKWRCGQETFHLVPNRQGLALVYYKFTSTGAELARLISRQSAAAYVNALKERFSGPFTIE